MNPGTVFHRGGFSEIRQHSAVLPASTNNQLRANGRDWTPLAQSVPRERNVVYAEQAGKISLDVDGRRWAGACATDSDAV